MRAGESTERVTLQRLDEATDQWENLANDASPWASVEAQGDGRYRFRVNYRNDLISKADIAPAMRLIYLDQVYDLIDVVENPAQRETQLIASRRIIEPLEDLPTGTRRIAVWP